MVLDPSSSPTAVPAAHRPPAAYAPVRTASAFVAALVSLPASAAAFTLLYWIGGTTDIPIGKVFTAMVGVHVLIGIGEAVITALTVGAVLAVRPDLVHGVQGLAAPLKLRVDGELVDAPAATREPEPAAAHRSTRGFWITGLVSALLLAGFVSFYASASPDGLERVAADQGIDEKVEEHGAADSPLADYGVGDIANARLSGGLAGVIGVSATWSWARASSGVVRRKEESAEKTSRDHENV
ncbi:Cobalt ABC transporter permease OS=Streptomyces cyaneofuscatus OX=66883 GN=G3I52_33590 PE=4 SV=1 [Streptomyces cyaneofuscatus]